MQIINLNLSCSTRYQNASKLLKIEKKIFFKCYFYITDLRCKADAIKFGGKQFVIS